MKKEEEKISFWTTLPGIITAIATLIGALAGLIAIMNSSNSSISENSNPSKPAAVAELLGNNPLGSSEVNAIKPSPKDSNYIITNQQNQTSKTTVKYTDTSKAENNNIKDNDTFVPKPEIQVAKQVYNPVLSDSKPTKIKNRWKSNEYINIENDKVQSSEIKTVWLSARWYLEQIADTKYYRIRNFWKKNQYLHIENGYLQCSEIEQKWHSAYWSIEPVDGSTFVQIRNRWKGTRYIHIEHGKLECSEIEQKWLSPQWTLETVD